MTKSEFLEKARAIHGYKYNYINLNDVIKSNDIIEILYDDILYKQRVSKHINMARCPEKNTPIKTTNIFIKEAKEIWGDKYDYSLVEYKGALEKVKIIYDGIIFEQVAISHLRKLAPELKMNLEYFIKKSKDKWGNKYDYSLVEYKTNKDKVKIIFNGKIYYQTPSNHLNYAPEKLKIKTNEEFVEQCSILHRYKYKYDKTIYTLSKNEVIINCPIHGYFKQRADSHLAGAGCIKCGYINDREYRHKYDTLQFIEEAKKIWGDKYDYSLVEYKNIRTKIKIIYDDIIYLQTPGAHLKYPVEGFLNQEIFIKRAIKKWGNKYDYSLVNFKSTKIKVKILYKNKIYEQLPYNHLYYAPEKVLRKTNKEFIEQSKKLHGNKYLYDKVNYVNDRKKIIIGCRKHGYFLQAPGVHLRGGCPHCNESKGEKEVSKILNKYNIIYNRQYKFENCRNKLKLPFDFYIPSARTCIEFDGIQHFQPVEYFGGLRAYEYLKINDKIKEDYCEENYINLIRIRYDQFHNIEKILLDNLSIFMKR